MRIRMKVKLLAVALVLMLGLTACVQQPPGSVVASPSSYIMVS